ncbi:hypothetical protein N7E81_05600 [Reichenbachiella carrageenanivorans]|uniref:Carbohydrate-binding family V/XII n=1 Tax=Reichenbachiella carrageenanivorans TaxID=2979869 RepID=A0ABY6D377_9BACT|nr:hypothetical protein [Reichenbachiella carrageenanivorans]UXX80573.1 hypothetical protein N7E81_05600 [Reichenbachiella carrageenanivorans]
MCTSHRYIFLSIIFISRITLGQGDDQTSFWPKEITAEKGTVIMYQPQPELLKGDILEARAAISVTPAGEQAPIFGAIWMTSYLDIDKSERSVNLVSVKVNHVRLPEEVDSTRVKKLKTFLEEEMIKWSFEMNYDQLLATLEEVDVIENASFENKAPKIIFRESGAILIVVDGEPKFKGLEKGYEQLINAPAFIVKKKSKYFLYGGNMWFRAKDNMNSWERLKNPPTSLTSLQKKYNPSDEDPLTEKSDEVPEIIMAYEPSELVVTDGKLKFTPIDNTQLLYVDNTESDIFMDINSQNYYILLSGRWFMTKSLDGPWVYAQPEKLSKEFAKIPEESVKGEVLAAVPGTDAAREAVLDANIPQTAAIDRKTATASVTYDGEPKFEPIAETSLASAVNTSSAVFKSKDVYFLCDNAVWFRSATPNGPWVVSDVRPVDIDKIPASNPAYHVKYVYIYDSTPEVVYVGYTPGYVGCYVYGSTVVYGTGYYYSGWYGLYYYPRPVTYGFSVRYSPYYGWSMGVSVGFGGPGYWYHGVGWWGPPVYRPPYYRPPYHHRPPGYRPPGYRPPSSNHRPPSGGVHQPSTRPATANNLYKNRKNGVRPSTRPSATRPSNTKPMSRPANRPSGQERYKPATRPANTGSSRSPNNVYTDQSGNVYRKGNEGWETRQNKQWSAPTHQPNRNTNQNLNQSYQNRQRGTQRTQGYNRVRSAGGGRGRR